MVPKAWLDNADWDKVEDSSAKAAQIVRNR
jgi:hypothetical protein